MCTSNRYTYVYPDGHKETTTGAPILCTYSRHSKPCSQHTVIQHPLQYVSSSFASAMPPTPSYTPRSSTSIHRSGDESDRSYHSGGSKSSSRKHRTSGVYINGHQVVDLGLERNGRRSSNSRHERERERIVLVDSPPTPRTPPQAYDAPRTAPSSPAMPFGLEVPSREYSTTRRPIIVDERKLRSRVEVDTLDPSHAYRRHSRQASSSSYDSRYSYTSDEEKALRRRKREEQRQREEAEAREQSIRNRIAKANAKIATRPAVPMAPPAPTRSSIKPSASPKTTTSGYVRPHVEVHTDKEAELAEAVRNLTFEEHMAEEKMRKLARKEAKRAAKAEEEEQKQRLKERIMPQRRATVGPGSRRRRDGYGEAVYRWE